MSSNGAVTRSTQGRDISSRPAAKRDGDPTGAGACSKYRNYMVVTFDRPAMGAIVCENHDQLYGVIQRWMEKNAPFIEYVSPIENALIEDPIQAMFCGPGRTDGPRPGRTCAVRFPPRLHRLRTQYDFRDLCIVDLLNAGCSKGHALERWANIAASIAARSWPSATITTTSRC